MARGYFTAVSQVPVSVASQLPRCLTGLRSFGFRQWRGESVGENGTGAEPFWSCEAAVHLLVKYEGGKSNYFV